MAAHFTTMEINLTLTSHSRLHPSSFRLLFGGMRPSLPILSFCLAVTFNGMAMGAEIPGNFSRQSPTPASTTLNQWWLNFHDAQLNGLIADALASSPSLVSATARVREARARRLAAVGDFFPQISGSASALRSQTSGNGRLGGGSQLSGSESSNSAPVPQNLFSGSLDASWEIDIFGRIRNNVASLAAQAQAIEEARNDVLISLIAEIVSNYVELRGLQAQRGVLQANLDSQEKTVGLTKSRLEAGLSPELVVAQAQAQLAITKASIPSVEVAIASAMHRLGTLTGNPAGTYIRQLDAVRPIPTGPSSVPAGLPAELLQRRPDVRQAERNFASSTSQVGVARAARLPRLSIGSSVGLESNKTGSLIEKDSQTWTVGPQISIPLFTGGKLKQNQRAAEAVRDQAQAAWDQVVLGAIEDVESALVSLRQSQARVAALREAEKASNRAYDLANELYKNGLGDFLNVLEAQRSQLAAQEQVVIGQKQVSLELVRLYKALGGGWEDPANTVPAAAKK